VTLYEKKIFGRKTDEALNWRGGGHYIMRTCIIYTFRKIFGLSNKEERNGRGMWHRWGRKELNTRFSCRHLREKTQLDRHRRRWDNCVNGSQTWTGFTWIRIGTSDWIFQYISNKMQRYTVYFIWRAALHVSGGTITHHQERKQLYLQHLVFVTPLLTNTRCCRYSCLRSWWWVEVPTETCRAVCR